MKLSDPSRRYLLTAGVASLLIILALELTLSIRRETQTWDEACHIFAGYSYWTHGDFGMNPEHPPLVKLLATLPLLPMSLTAPPHDKVFSKEQDFTSAEQFVYSNNANAIVFRTRMSAALLTFLLALLLFAATREMFGMVAAFLALILFVFEPNILAHGALVTTDMGMSCFLFATVYAFYRYAKKPSRARLGMLALAAGLALAAKHSGILIFPILVALGLAEVLITRKSLATSTEYPAQHGFRLARALVVAGIAAIMILWASYGFHFHPRTGFDAEPRLVSYAGRLNHPFQEKLITSFARWHLLPQPYLYGLADVGITAGFSHTYLFGKVYPHGQWFYFPAAFLVKTTLPLMIFLLLLPVAIVARGARRRRQLWFLTLPPAIYLAVAMSSGMNIGIRHILPIYPFLMMLAGWTAAELVRYRRRWMYAVALVILFGVVSSLRAFPVYLAYSNELWGGPANTYKYLSDSNVDWGQQLKAVKKYLDSRHVQNCWFAYFAQVVADPGYYGIPCKPLTTIASVWLQPTIDVPPSLDGPVLISAGVLSGYEFGPGPLNPYDQFQRMTPTAVIEHGVFVFDGHFEIPLASALNHVTRAQLFDQSGNLDAALEEAQAAVQLAPGSVQTQAELGNVLNKLNRKEEARQAFQTALILANSIRPEFQQGWVAGLRASLGQ
ncbi:MAG TPA: phospholipid carrier-dependent glycosyltransferase [Terriglobales bacterium]